MASARLAPWVCLLVCMLSVLKTESVDVTNTIVENAVEKGAVCLDGTPPAYALHEGSGEAANNWVIYLEGGGWCATEAECLFRTTKDVGSSKRWQKEKSSLISMLSDNEYENPYFYKWTRVYVRYCDGSSYVGDREEPFVGNNTTVYFRGVRVFNAIMEDLLAKGMKSASNTLLTGCSAGGLGALLPCDNFRSLLPGSAKVKCAADAADPFLDDLTAKIKQELKVEFDRKLQNNMSMLLKKLAEANPDLNLDLGDCCATMSSEDDENGTPLTGGSTL